MAEPGVGNMYDYENQNNCGVNLFINELRISIYVAPKGYAPTAEHEAEGVTAKMIGKVAEGLLKKTDDVTIRRLLEADGLIVPDQIVESTKHLSEFGGDAPASVLTAKPTKKAKEPRARGSKAAGLSDESVQTLQDALCSTGKGKVQPQSSNP